MKKRIIIIGVLVFIAWVVMINLEDQEEAFEGIDEEHTPEEQFESVYNTQANIDEGIEVFGTVEAKEVKNLSFNQATMIKELHVKEGQRIEAEDNLMTLDLSESQNDLAIKKRNYQNKKDLLEKRQEELKQANTPEFKKLFHELEVNENKYLELLLELDEKKDLLAKEAISEKEVEDFKNKITDKKAKIKSLQFDKKDLVYHKEEEIKELEESIFTEKKKLENIKKQLDDPFLAGAYLKENKIKAAIDSGIVYDINYSAGDNLRGENKLLSIIDLDSLIVKANVPERFIRDINQGDRVTIEPLADSSKEYEGEIVRISNRAIRDNAETTIPVEIVIKDRDEFLLPGFNVDVIID